MKREALTRDVTSPPEGSRTPTHPRTARPPVEKFPSTHLQKLSDFSKGTHVQADGSIYGFEAIRDAVLTPEQRVGAQVLWILRNFVIATGKLGSKPIEEWSIEDVIGAARDPR